MFCFLTLLLKFLLSLWYWYIIWMLIFLIKHIYRVGWAHQYNSEMENYKIRHLNTNNLLLLWDTWKCTTKNDIVRQKWTQNWVVEGTKGWASHTKQNTSAQLPFHIRLDPLKLPRDPLKGVAKSSRALLKIPANGSLLQSVTLYWLCLLVCGEALSMVVHMSTSLKPQYLPSNSSLIAPHPYHPPNIRELCWGVG